MVRRHVTAPERFCNLDRLLIRSRPRTRRHRRVAALQRLLFSGLPTPSPTVRTSREPYAVRFHGRAWHPVLVVADYYLATFLTQPTWIEAIRPFGR